MSRAALAASFVLAWVLIAACGSDTPQPETHPTGTSPATATATAATPSASPSGTTTAPAAIQHVFVIVLENESGSSAIRDPYLSQLAGRGARLTNYTAVAHPSQPNYIAMIAGATLVSDDATHNLKETNLVDLLDAAHVSWKAYMEGYPGFCFPGASATTPAGGAYVRKHNPFISFDDIRTDARRCANIVDAGQLDGEIAAGRLPAFSFYTPNLDNDGHDTSLGYASKWLKGFLEPKLSDPRFADGTLVIVTFDEGDGTPATDPLYTVLLGPMVSAGSLDSTPYTHYSLLRTVESVFGLPTLGRGDAAVTPFAACNFEGGCGR